MSPASGVRRKCCSERCKVRPLNRLARSRKAAGLGGAMKNQQSTMNTDLDTRAPRRHHLYTLPLGAGFTVRFYGRDARPVFRFFRDFDRFEEIPRDEAARLIRQTRRTIRGLWSSHRW